ncbi:MAG: nuclear transport factor 2 family protein [Candidatus Limnocylindria bacterium]
MNVNTETSREMMARYFADLDDGDAARHLTEDVVWINEETGERITGRAAVIGFVRALHERMGDLRTRTYIVGEDAAIIEGDCIPFAAADTHTGDEPEERLPYVVVYDLTPSGIAAMRLYMSITRLPVTV